MSFSSPLLLVGGIILIWFIARFGFGRRYGAPSISGMFRREAPMVEHGLGPKALRMLLNDFKTLVAGDNALRGLILAGPFAAHRGSARAAVTIIVLATDTAPYFGRSWFARWPYINRGHLVVSHAESAGDGVVLHRFTLRGAPELAVAFTGLSVAAPPAEIADAVLQAAIVVETGTPDAKALLGRWASLRANT